MKVDPSSSVSVGFAIAEIVKAEGQAAFTRFERTADTIARNTIKMLVDSKVLARIANVEPRPIIPTATQRSPRIQGWLEELTRVGVYGQTPEEVAESFVLEGIRRELRGDGFIRVPPPTSTEEACRKILEAEGRKVAKMVQKPPISPRDSGPR